MEWSSARVSTGEVSTQCTSSLKLLSSLSFALVICTSTCTPTSSPPSSSQVCQPQQHQLRARSLGPRADASYLRHRHGPGADHVGRVGGDQDGGQHGDLATILGNIWKLANWDGPEAPRYGARAWVTFPRENQNDIGQDLSPLLSQDTSTNSSV